MCLGTVQSKVHLYGFLHLCRVREMVRGCRYASNLEVRVDATLSMTHLSALIAGGANVIISCLCNTRGHI